MAGHRRPENGVCSESLARVRYVAPGWVEVRYLRLPILFCALQCDAGIGTNALFQQLYRTPQKHLVLGAGCSAVSGATAQVSHLWNLVQVRDALAKRFLDLLTRYSIGALKR